MEADYGVIFRIPLNADSDGFPSAQFPLYGGRVTTPDGSTVIVMEYVNHTWRLPKMGSPVLSMPFLPKSLSSSLTSAGDLSDIVITSNIPTCNSFSSLPEDFDSCTEAYVPTFLSNERVEGRLQQRFENMCRLRKEAVTLHRAHGHPNNRTLLLNLEAHGIPHKHFKRYILVVSGDAWGAAIGKRDNKTSAVTVTKRQNIAEQKKNAKAQRKLSAQKKSDQIPITTSSSGSSDELEISPITDVIDPSTTITESLANLHRFTALPDEFDYSTLTPSATAYSVESSTFAQLGSESFRYQSRFAETTAFRNLQKHSSAPVSVFHDHHNDAVHSPPMTDLRMDWADACSLGRLPSLNRYFLLILDKGTKHWATYPSKSRGRGTPVELFKQYVLTTGRKPRYLRVDNAKEYKRWLITVRTITSSYNPSSLTTTQCKHAWRAPLAVLSDTPALPYSAPTNPPVSGLMQLLTSSVNETPCGQNGITKDNFQLPTLVCSLPSPAHIEQ